MSSSFNEFLKNIEKDIESGNFDKKENDNLIIKEVIPSPLRKISVEVIDESLKLFGVYFDSCGILLYSKDLEDVKNLLLEEDECFIFKENGECYYDFGGTLCEVEIVEIKKSRKIISWESH